LVSTPASTPTATTPRRLSPSQRHASLLDVFTGVVIANFTTTTIDAESAPPPRCQDNPIHLDAMPTTFTAAVLQCYHA
jgi:hypothetical protein